MQYRPDNKSDANMGRRERARSAHQPPPTLPSATAARMIPITLVQTKTDWPK